MKIGDLKLSLNKQDKNNISTFIKDNTIISAFEKTAEKQPDKNAVYDGTDWITYGALKASADSISSFIQSLSIEKGSFIAIMAERKNVAVAVMLGIMKAGCAYVPIDPELPEKRILQMINECSSPLLFFTSKYMRGANILQWNSASMNNICCVDTDDFYSVIESTGEIMDEALWDAVAENADTDVQAGGWKDPYSGEWISDDIMDSFSVNVFEKLQKYTDKNSVIMEIGSASGLSLKRLAPLCSKYFATDISSSMLDFLKSNLVSRFANVETFHTPAHNIDTLKPNTFDVIIINSVAQSFPGHNYMRDVMKKCDSMLNDCGVIFLGNIYDASKKGEFEKSFIKYKMTHPESNVKAHFDAELFFHQDFFADWAANHSYTTQFSDTNVEADFFSYGYDVVLVKNGKEQQAVRAKRQFSRSDLTESSCADLSENGDNAYGIFTSGTTGTPKGVQIAHRSVLNLAETLYDMIYKDGAVRTGVFPSFSFDPSVQQIFPALIYGSEVVIIPETFRKDPVELYSFVKDSGIEFMDLTPAMASVFTDYAIGNGLKCPLTHLIVGGEQFSKNLAKEIFRWNSSLHLINAYGPTECCVSATYYELDADKLDKLPSIHIGSPVKNTEIFIFDDAGNPIPEGLQGEICVSGEGVSRGYINDSKLTDEKFTPHPFNPDKKVYRTGDIGREFSPNLFMFNGRKDTQVKVRGYRIELAEIENTALKLAELNNCAVVCRDFSESGNPAIVLYFTSDTPQEPAHIKASLIETLPEYMIPEYVIQIESIPLNSSGKIDYKALPNPQIESEKISDGEKPSTKNQIKIADFIKQLTGLPNWTIDDNFFDSGGNSILAVRLISMIHTYSGKRIPLTYLMKHPTIRLLAAYLENRVSTEKWTPLIPVSTCEQSTDDLFCFHPVGGSNFCYHHLSVALKNMYNITMTQSPGMSGNSKPMSDCKEIGRLFCDEILQNFPDSPKILIGWSFGALIALETAREMIERGLRPKCVVIIDMTSGNNRISKEMLSSETGINKLFIDLFGLNDLNPEETTREQIRERVLKLGIETGFFPEGMEDEICNRLLDVAMANAHASVTYTPQKYDGEVLLIRATEITRSSFIDSGEDAFLGWKNYLSNITLKWVDATHETILSPDVIPETARHIKDFIKRLK
ncbi:MAG: hypothetical protein C0602_06385 [Denitrovibrio sp.]|nr:MAG: hypothetical protein C0602_06385 [Denitrovibrio sp.]